MNAVLARANNIHMKMRKKDEKKRIQIDLINWVLEEEKETKLQNSTA